MTDLKRPTPAKAKAVWESLVEEGIKPTVRQVSQILLEEGFHAPYRTLARWKELSWSEHGTASRACYNKPRNIKRAMHNSIADLPEREAKVAKGGLEAAISMPPDPTEVATIDKEMLELIGDIKTMALDEIHERTRLALNVVLMRRAAAKADLLVLVPKDIAALIVSMTDAAKTVSSTMTTVENPRMIDVTPATSQLAVAIEQFKRRTGVAA